MKGKAYQGRKKLHTLHDIAKYPEVTEVKRAPQDCEGRTAKN